MKRIFFISAAVCFLFFTLSSRFTDPAYSQTGLKKTVYSEELIFETALAPLGIKDDSAAAYAGPLSALGCLAALSDRAGGERLLLYSSISSSFYIFSMSGGLEKTVKLNSLNGYGPPPVFSDIAVSADGKIYACDIAGDRLAVFNGDLGIIKSVDLADRSVYVPDGIYSFINADCQGNLRAYAPASSTTTVFSGDALEKRSSFKGFVSSFSAPSPEEKNIYFAEYSANIVKFMEAPPGDQARVFFVSDYPADVRSVYFIGGRGGILYFLIDTLNFDGVIHTVVEIGTDKKFISGVRIDLQQECFKPLKIILSPSGRLLFLKKKGEKYAVVELKKNQVLE